MISDKHITTPHERVKVTSVTWLPRSNSWIRRVLKFILWASSPFRVVRERACEGAAQPRGSSSRVSFCVVLLRDLWRYPPKFPRSLSNYTCPVFRLILFFGTRSENVLESRNLIFLNEFMAHEKCDPHSQTQRKTSPRNSHSISLVRSIELVIIFLNPLTGKMKRVLPSDWLPSPSCYLEISRFSPAG